MCVVLVGGGRTNEWVIEGRYLIHCVSFSSRLGLMVGIIRPFSTYDVRQQRTSKDDHVDSDVN